MLELLRLKDVPTWEVVKKWYSHWGKHSIHLWECLFCQKAEDMNRASEILFTEDGGGVFTKLPAEKNYASLFNDMVLFWGNNTLNIVLFGKFRYYARCRTWYRIKDTLEYAEWSVGGLINEKKALLSQRSSHLLCLKGYLSRDMKKWSNF